LPGSTGLFGPRWSPNGLYIAAVTVDQKKLMLFRVDAGRWSELTSGNEIELPNWSRDGQFVNFESSSENGSELLRVNISTRQVERLVNFKGIPRYLLITGNYWNGQAADGSPLIMRDVGSREIYALDMQWP